jgi:hypothetical protein
MSKQDTAAISVNQFWINYLVVEAAWASAIAALSYQSTS